jgi:hypothetical protein
VHVIVEPEDGGHVLEGGKGAVELARVGAPQQDQLQRRRTRQRLAALVHLGQLTADHDKSVGASVEDGG